MSLEQTLLGLVRFFVSTRMLARANLAVEGSMAGALEWFVFDRRWCTTRLVHEPHFSTTRGSGSVVWGTAFSSSW